LKIPSSKDRAAGPASKRVASVWSFALYPLLGGLAAIGLLAALIFGRLLPTAADALDAQYRETHGRTYAALLDSRVMELRRWLGAAAAAPSVRAALSSADPAALREAGQLIGSLLEFTTRVEVFTPDGAQLDTEAEVPISYAALDLIKRAQAGRFEGPEAIEGARRAIYAAHPVDADGRVIGVVFAAIDRQFFLAPFAAFDPGHGELTLEQAFDRHNTVAVLAWGEADPAAQPERLELAVPHWTLVYRPGRPTLPAELANNHGLTTVALAVTLLGIALFAGFYRLAAGLRSDSAQLRARLVDPQAPGASANYQLAVFAALDAVVPAQVDQSAIAEPGAPQPVLTAAAPAEVGAGEFLEIAAASGAPAPAEPTASAPVAPTPSLAPGLFRASGIGGTASAGLTDDAVCLIGRAYAAEAVARGLRRVAVGRDGRNSSKALRDALVRGLTQGGADVVDLGEVPTPLLYFATHALETGNGIMITGSHLEPEYNGLILVLDGEALGAAALDTLRERIEQGALPDGDVTGEVSSVDLQEAYLERILSDVVIAQPLKVVVDGGNGVAGALAAELIGRLDCEVVPLYCDVDGSFPNHLPDPGDPRNLDDLMTVVKAEGADLGIAFDGDGDRVGVVTASGRVVWPDRLLMLFAQDIVGRNPGADIVYDVKCSRHLNAIVSELGGRPIMWKSGPANLKSKLRETGALLAGEFDGHICFGERWYGFDDGLYSAARLLEILGTAHDSVDALFAPFPRTCSTPELNLRTTDSWAVPRISSSRAALYRPSSNPYQRSPKQMWPSNSPARRAPVSRSLLFRFAGPLFHMIGLPPSSLTIAFRWRLHFTS